MALANVAALLADWGKRVLVVDWDLEAPGIERYFLNSPSVVSAGREGSNGVLDLIYDLKEGREMGWQKAVVKAWPRENGPSLDIITAGRATSEYNRRVQEVDWTKALLKFKLMVSTFLEREFSPNHQVIS